MKCNFLKMLSIALLALNVTSCIDNMPKEEVLPRDAVSFEYYIDKETDSIYYLDFYIDSDITFKNTSLETTQGEPVWDFGDGTVVSGQTVTHFYAKAGTYEVKLTIGSYSSSSNLSEIETGILELSIANTTSSRETSNFSAKYSIDGESLFIA